jgi:hypothetical protein
MPSSPEIAQTEQRIAEIDALQQTIEQLQQDLQLYREALRRELDLLQAPADGAGEASARDELVEVPNDEIAYFGEPSQGGGDAEGSATGEIGDAPSPFELEEPSDKVGGKPVSVMISDNSLSDEPMSGWVLDRPQGGLKILVDDDIKVGTVIGVRPTREHPDAQWINVSVKSSKPERSSFVIVCSFVERPPWKALAQFN